MAVGLVAPTSLLPVPGIELGAIASGIKKNGDLDLVLIKIAEGAEVAAVFTKNVFCAAPVTVAKRHLDATPARALLINSGNANAGTGTQGILNAEASCKRVAKCLALDATEVLPFSTGVISESLPIDKVCDGVDQVSNMLSEMGWLEAARGIATTDTVIKGHSQQVEVDGKTITVTGISKGSGMICPNMATMLGYVATDAVVDTDALQACLTEVNERTFNSITVDGDTSTNDACVLIATGRAGNATLAPQHPDWAAFKDAVEQVMRQLAQAIIRDGEGATKFIELHVTSGRSVDESREVAYTVAHSPLVKTAFFASDPNLGRILAAIGRARVTDFSIERTSVFLDEVCLVRDGEPDPHYTEEQGQAVMNRAEITIHIDLGRGDAEARIWTSDLSYEYVKINSEYRS